MPNNYVLLERIELNATAASVTFSNIPQTGYTDLKLVWSARRQVNPGYALVNFNNLATANFSNRVLEGNGASASSFVNGSTNYAGALVAAADTANTFGSSEMYIPNYTSSNFKSYSIEAVSENNGTTAYADMIAGLWSNTAAINAIKLTTHDGASFAIGSTFSLYGVAKLGTTPAIAPKANGGNVIGTDGTYWYHAFLSSGTFTPQVGLNADVMVIAGGGGGGENRGSGGGAGGFRVLTAQTLVASTNYTCTVGAGGVGGSATDATTGINSSIAGSGLTTISASGGGAGRGSAGTAPANGVGGSGSGGAHNPPAAGAAGNVGGYSPVEGYAGGAANGASAGGGGGASQVGFAAPASNTGGAGGAGSSAYSAWGSATGTGQNSGGTYYYAGGAGGGSYGGGAGGSGGLGGGGKGGQQSTADQTAGTVNTGGGGGGGGGSSDVSGRAGGSGIVIVRYLVA
jgi:hypothetical protein